MIAETNPAPTARHWRAAVAPYEGRSGTRATLQLLTTWIPLIALFVAMYQALDVSYWITLALALPAGGLLVRTFIVMHDCGHGSFYSSRRLNDVIGWVSGLLTLTPYAQWRRDHALHHASSGDLDRRGHGDVKTLTVREFAALSPRGQLAYRIMRHPAILLGVGPLHLMLVQRIRPPGTPLSDPQTRSVWSTNAGIVGVLGVLGYFFGLRHVMLVYLPAIYIAAAAGIWLFFVQHQFEDTYWAPHPEWDYLTASVRGSSYLDLPAVLRWFTGNIGVHHVHHLSPRIPNYRLQRCHEENALFHDVRKLSFIESFRMFRLALWDEDRQCLVPFSGTGAVATSQPPRPADSAPAAASPTCATSQSPAS